MATKAKTQAPVIEQEMSLEEPEVQLTGITLTRETFQRDYPMVGAEGFFKLKVSSVSRELPMLDRDGEQVFSNTDGRALSKHIVNLKAIPAQHVKAVRELWKGRESIDLAELRGKTMSVNAIIPADGGIDLPFNGQTIGVQAGFVENSDGDQVLVGTAYQLPAAKAANSFSFEDDDEILPEA